MRYNNNMEPQIPKVRTILSPELIHSLEAQDGTNLMEHVSRLKQEDSPTAVWAEAIGTRLQIRDFLVQQKGGLAALQANQDLDLKQNVANYLHAFDSNLTTLTGHYGRDRPPATPQQLKETRLDRLTREPANDLVELIGGLQLSR